MGVLPAITQHRTSASGFWEIPGASWPAARMIRPIPAADAPSRSPTQFPVLTRTPLVFQSLHAVFVICVSRSHTYEVLISFSAKYRRPHPCLPVFKRAVYVSREFWPGVSVGRRTTLSRVKKAAATKISLFAYLWQLFFVRSYLNEFIRTLPSMC